MLQFQSAVSDATEIQHRSTFVPALSVCSIDSVSRKANALHLHVSTQQIRLVSTTLRLVMRTAQRRAPSSIASASFDLLQRNLQNALHSFMTPCPMLQWSKLLDIQTGARANKI